MRGCRPLSDAEIAAILATIEKGSFPLRDKAIFILGIRSGFRISELLSLRVGQVFQNGAFVDDVAVDRRYMKKKTEGRIVPMHQHAKDAVKALVLELKAKGRGEPQDYLFQSRQGKNRALGRCAAWSMIQTCATAVGITGKIGTHCMRKTFAKKMYEKLDKNLIDTQEALGHKQVSSTAAYLSFNNKKIKDAILSD